MKENNENSNNIYHNCGYFVIEFEQLVLSIKFCIFSLLKLKGLSEPEYLRVILNDLTANPLLSKLQTLVAMHYKNETEKIKILEKLFTHTISIIEKRNEIIHGSFFVISEQNANLFKDKTNKLGLKPLIEEVDSKTLLNYTSKVIETKKMYELLNSYLNEPDENFDYFFNKETLEVLNIKSK